MNVGVLAVVLLLISLGILPSALAMSKSSNTAADRSGTDSYVCLKLPLQELTLGALLEAIRIADEVAQAAIARRLGITRLHLCDIEKGRKTVSPERAARFARILGYGPEQFVRLALQDQVRHAGLRLTVRVEAA